MADEYTVVVITYNSPGKVERYYEHFNSEREARDHFEIAMYEYVEGFEKTKIGRHTYYFEDQVVDFAWMFREDWKMMMDGIKENSNET